jgi:simple sugar transport system permease protein
MTSVEDRMTTEIIQQSRKNLFVRNRLAPGLILIAIGLVILFLFGVDTEAGQQATFGMNAMRSQALPIPDLTLPVQPAIYILILVTVFLGAWQLARGIRSTGIMVGVVAFCFVVAFLIWATRDKSFNLVGMLSSSLVRATPIALAALCGVISERAAVVNIAIEGIMLITAQTAVMAGTLSHNLYVGLIVALLTGALVAAIHAVLVIKYKVDQIVSGVAINIFGAGITSFISSRFLERNGDLLNNSGTFPVIPIPLLSKIPILGPIFFENNLIVYLTILLVIVLHVLLFYTPWGLRTRAVGEHPKAADTLGINVFMMRYVNVIIGGMIAGLGGAYFTLGSVGRFDEIMTAGKGFIGLAAMIFGKWNPFGAFTSSLIFGFADSLQVKMQILKVPIPSQILGMAPYLVTMIVLAGLVGRAIPPAADGTPYEKQ